MSRVKFVGLLVVALSLGSLLMANMASAATEILPTTINKYTGENTGATKPRLETLNGNIVECTKAKGEGTVAAKEGTASLKITFEPCESIKPFKEPCTPIVTTGTVDFVHDVTKEGSTYAMLFLLSPDTKFECTALVKLTVLGDVLCLITEPTVSKATHTFVCANNKTTGDPLETEFWKNGVKGTASLLTSTNNGTEESSAEVAEGTFTTLVGTVSTASALMG